MSLSQLVSQLTNEINGYESPVLQIMTARLWTLWFKAQLGHQPVPGCMIRLIVN